MKIRIALFSSKTSQEAVDAINKKLGTTYTVFDYNAWESGMDTEGSKQFAKSVEKYVGSTKYKIVTALALVALKLKHLIK